VGGPGPVPGGIRPLRPHKGIRCTPRIPGRKTGFQSGTVVDRAGPRGDRSMRRRRTWTHSSTEGRSKGAHAVEFSKTVAPRRKDVSFPGRARESFRSRSGPMSIAPVPPRGGGTSAGWPERASCPWLRQLGRSLPRTAVGPVSAGARGSLSRRSRARRVADQPTERAYTTPASQHA